MLGTTLQSRKVALVEAPDASLSVKHWGEWKSRHEESARCGFGICRTLHYLYYSVKLLRKLIRPEDCFLALLAPLSAWYCYEQGYQFKMTFNIISMAAIYPQIYAIKASVKRRDSALQCYSQLQAAAQQLFIICKSWGKTAEERDQESEEAHYMRFLIYGFLHHSRQYLGAPLDVAAPGEVDILHHVSEISETLNGLSKPGGGHVSRAQQYVYIMHTSYEQMRHMKEYRTPAMLRAFGYLSTALVPLLYGPFFAKLAADFHWLFACVVAMLFSFIILALVNLDDIVENPFDIDDDHGEYIDLKLHDWQLEASLKLGTEEETAEHRESTNAMYAHHGESM